MTKDRDKIVVFDYDSYGIDGRTLDPVCRDPNDIHCVPNEVLRWHFRQSILANMRGAGEPIFETDFPPGTDMMATRRDEAHGKELFEKELEFKLRRVTAD